MTGERMTQRELNVVMGALAVTLLLAALDQTIVSTALPTMVGELGGLDHYSWVVTAYMLTSTTGVPLFGKISDLIGRKVVLQFAVVSFLAGSVLAGMAQDMTQLIITRALQGIGGGGIMAMSFVVMGDLVTPRERGKYAGYFTGVFAMSSVIGPLVGGFLVDQLSWRWVFYVNMPIGVVSLLALQRFLHMPRTRIERKIDWLGAALLVTSVSCVLLVCVWGGRDYAWGSPTIVGLAVTAMVLGGLFVVQESRAPEPLLPLRLFRDPVIRVSVILSFLLGTAMFGAMTFLPLFLQVVTGASPTRSGLLLLPMMGGVLTGSTLSGRLTSRTGRYRVFPIAGTSLAIVGILVLSRLDADSNRIHSSLGMLILGFGIGMTMPTLTLAVQNAAPMADLGVATSSVNFFRSLGGSLGVAVFGAVMTSKVTGIDARLLNSPAAIRQLPEGPRTAVIDALASGVHAVFVWAIPVVVVAAVVAWLLKELPLRTTFDMPAVAESAAEGALVFEPNIEPALAPPVH
jgi:EmrB/QacA subfamily drug resistance transporter